MRFAKNASKKAWPKNTAAHYLETTVCWHRNNATPICFTSNKNISFCGQNKNSPGTKWTKIWSSIIIIFSTPTNVRYIFVNNISKVLLSLTWIYRTISVSSLRKWTGPLIQFINSIQKKCIFISLNSRVLCTI